MDNGDSYRSSKGRYLRPVRNRRYNRRIFDEEKRPAKRLFTPEIKKYLKDWLVRRRDNPYPSRDEKKRLSVETGLTYIQVCNWFANWRRKLKNAGKEPQRKTWSHLIKSYNSQAKGNVEHFSICSDDSIWEEFESLGSEKQEDTEMLTLDHCYTTQDELNGSTVKPQCSHISSTTGENISFSNNKYKSHIMEKYLKDIDHLNTDGENICNDAPLLFTKWLESTANFQPRKKNYIDWCGNDNRNRLKKKIRHDSSSSILQGTHLREELDAAEALTTLANANSMRV